MTSQIEVRPVREQDQAKVSEVWYNGLEQTVESILWAPRFLVRPLTDLLFHSLIKENYSENGCFGPEGRNITANWGKTDRCMYVACIDEEIVGLCGVKIGKEEDSVAEGTEELKVASIWRLSVDSRHRRKGIGEQLLSQCENWARDKKCETMTLVTGNQIAHKFYLKVQFEVTEVIELPSSVLTRYVLPVLLPSLKVRRYSKPLL